MTGPETKLNGLAQRAGQVMQLVTLVGLGVGFGINYSRIQSLENAVSRMESVMGAPSLLANQSALEIAVLKSELVEIQKKIDQLQAVVIETRNIVMHRSP